MECKKKKKCHTVHTLERALNFEATETPKDAEKTISSVITSSEWVIRRRAFHNATFHSSVSISIIEMLLD